MNRRFSLLYYRTALVLLALTAGSRPVVADSTGFVIAPGYGSQPDSAIQYQADPDGEFVLLGGGSPKSIITPMATNGPGSGTASFGIPPAAPDTGFFRVQRRSLPGRPAIRKVSCGLYNSTFVLTEGGRIWVWGRNTTANLGFVGRDQSRPRVGPAQRLWADMAPGAAHVLVTSREGEIWGWGTDSFGNLASGKLNSSGVPPGRCLTNQNWREVFSGHDHSLGIAEDGSLWQWGHSEAFAGSKHVTTPVLLDTQHSWVQAVGGYSHSLALTAEGDIWAIGLNGYHQMGVDPIRSTNLVRLVTNQKWKQISSGRYHSLAIAADDSLWVWGEGSGCGSKTNVVLPTPFAPEMKWAHIAGGVGFSVGIAMDGSLWTWGYSRAMPDPRPPNIGTLLNVLPEKRFKLIGAGEWQTIAVTEDNEIFTWGVGDFGSLGRGGSGSVPAEVTLSD